MFAGLPVASLARYKYESNPILAGKRAKGLNPVSYEHFESACNAVSPMTETLDGAWKPLLSRRVKFSVRR
jgi:hypothetical protein